MLLGNSSNTSPEHYYRPGNAYTQGPRTRLGESMTGISMGMMIPGTLPVLRSKSTVRSRGLTDEPQHMELRTQDSSKVREQSPAHRF